MKPEGEREEMLRLFGGLSDGTLTAGEHRRLQEVLSRSAAARRLWFLHCDLEHGLARWAATRRAAAANVIRLDDHPAAVRPPARPWRRALALAACLTALAVAGVVMLRSPRASASPVELTQQALAAHAAALDRCYRVSFNLGPSPRRGPGPAMARETRLWTRGDRFWNESRVGERTTAWGRDDQGRVWFTVSPELGGQFDADEVPERLAALCELRSLQPESLLRSLLADFELRREPDAATGGCVVHAELKPGHEHPGYRAALLEIDGASGVLRRVEVERTFPGRPPVHVSFTLVETGLRDDASYTLAGHLSEQAVVCDRHSDPGQRGRALVEFIGLLRGQARDESVSTQTR